MQSILYVVFLVVATTLAAPYFPGQVGSYSGSSSSSSQQSSYSTSTVTNSFNGLCGRIGSLQSQLASGSLSQYEATQSISRRSSSLQSALAQTPQCGSYFSNGAFVGSVKSAFHQFHSLVSSMKSTYGAEFGQVIAPFSGISSSFQSFSQSASSNRVSVTEIVPNGLSSLVPGFSAIGQ